MWKKLYLIGESSGCSKLYQFHHVIQILLMLFSQQKCSKDSIQSCEDVHLPGMVSVGTASKSGERKDHLPQKSMNTTLKIICHFIPATMTQILKLVTLKLFFYITWHRDSKLYITVSSKRKLPDVCEAFSTKPLCILLYNGGITPGSHWNHYIFTLIHLKLHSEENYQE